MRKDTENFILSAGYDLQTAEYMYETGRYIYVVFFCHLSIEKMLKAIITELFDKPAPKTHNLIYLIKLTGLKIPQDFLEFYSKN